MGLFSRKTTRDDDTGTITASWLEAWLKQIPVTEEAALASPYIRGCLELICGTTAALTYRLYQEKDGVVEELKDDYRLKLINDTPDHLTDGYAFKWRMMFDYLVHGRAFAYKVRERNKIVELRYVDQNCIQCIMNEEPIFKEVAIFVNGVKYRRDDFLIVRRIGRDDFSAHGFLEDNKEFVAMLKRTIDFETNQLSTGGIKKGVIKSQTVLKDTALQKLKEAWRNLYGTNSTENCIVLNNGLDYKELANTPVEMQLNEMLRLMNRQACVSLLTPQSLLEGTVGTGVGEIYQNYIKTTINTHLAAFESAFNSDILLENEKGSAYFMADTRELLRGDIEKRFKAYSNAIEQGFMQIDEVRYLEDLKPLGMNFLKMSLGEVLYDPESGDVYVPNTKEQTNLKKIQVKTPPEGGESVES